ncbi:hypothetical protein AB0F77_39595 [Streptomyces sp. NPDC026672]|uniref:hypothetical protein n=1 Tax=Actinomycetes TaxID=1760 RepID=UPI0033F581AE
MTYTLADAIRAQFDRDHPGNRGVLKCTSCYRSKNREEFRETPWHGRAAACRRCEGMRLTDEYALRDRWLLEQERAKVRMLVRHVQRLRLQRILTPTVRSADAFRAHHQPYYDAVERAQRRFLAALMTVPVPEFEQRRKRQPLTKENT